MPGERLKRKRILGLAIEATAGTAETLDAGDAAIVAYDAVIQDVTEYTERPKNGSMSQNPAQPGPKIGKLTFSTELIGGSSTILQVALQGCGAKLATGVLTPESMPPTEASSGTKTITAAIWQHGRKKQIHGAQGNCVIRSNGGKTISVEFEFWGVLDDEVDATAVEPTYPTAAPLKLASGSITLGSWALATSKCDFDFGNNLAWRYAGGVLMAAITDRSPKISVDPEATLVADNDVYGDAHAMTGGALEIAIGTTGNEVTIEAPNAVPRIPTEGDRDKLEVDELDIYLCADDDAGDDEWSITFS